MISIKKGKVPKELAEYCSTEGASYAGMHGAPSGRYNEDGSKIDVYSIVLNKLAKDQGYLCAYCMRRIPESKNKPPMTIEHIAPQCKSDELSLSYDNMIAVCSGNRNAKDNEQKTCDASRGNAPLTLNPLKPETLRTIDYRSSGKIFSADTTINEELNDILKLNSTERNLVRLRKSALNRMLKMIDEKGWSGDRNRYAMLLNQYRQETGEKTEFVGILINWLEKRT